MMAACRFPAPRPALPASRLPQVVMGGVLLGCLGWAAAGCAPRGPQRVAVSGSVTLDGLPVHNATIIFTPQGPGLAAAAMIENGKYGLSDLDGPTPGEHQVRINPNDVELELASPSEPPQAARRPKIPRVYQTDGLLKATVTGQSRQPLSFELTSNY